MTSDTDDIYTYELLASAGKAIGPRKELLKAALEAVPHVQPRAAATSPYTTFQFFMFRVAPLVSALVLFLGAGPTYDRILSQFATSGQVADQAASALIADAHSTAATGDVDSQFESSLNAVTPQTYTSGMFDSLNI